MLRSTMGIYTNDIVTMEQCPNFDICHKNKDVRLKVCSPCFWRFNNEVLKFDHRECPICYNTHKCVKFRKCTHYVCLTCFHKIDKCPVCRSDLKMPI